MPPTIARHQRLDRTRRAEGDARVDVLEAPARRTRRPRAMNAADSVIAPSFTRNTVRRRARVPRPRCRAPPAAARRSASGAASDDTSIAATTKPEHQARCSLGASANCMLAARFVQRQHQPDAAAGEVRPTPRGCGTPRRTPASPARSTSPQARSETSARRRTRRRTPPRRPRPSNASHALPAEGRLQRWPARTRRCRRTAHGRTENCPP